VVVFEGLVLAASLFHHSDAGLPAGLERALGRVVVTPALHWVHHHALRADTDSNYGTDLRLLGPAVRLAQPTRRWRGMPIGVERLRDRRCRASCSPLRRSSAAGGRGSTAGEAVGHGQDDGPAAVQTRGEHPQRSVIPKLGRHYIGPGSSKEGKAVDDGAGRQRQRRARTHHQGRAEGVGVQETSVLEAAMRRDRWLVVAGLVLVTVAGLGLDARRCGHADGPAAAWRCPRRSTRLPRPPRPGRRRTPS
jgi:hypothetical protein